MNEATREMTFEEEYDILKREKEEIFASEQEGCEPPLVNCVLRRALRCIDKLMNTSRREWYQIGYQDGLNADKWISCEERLPKKKGYYQCSVFRYEEDEYNVFDLWFEDGVWYVDEIDDDEEDMAEKYFIHDVLAWQPLPQEYKSNH